MKAFRLPLALCFFLITPWATYAQTKTDLIGTWSDNPKTSITISVISKTGQLNGTYSDRSGPIEQTFPLVGWVNLVEPGPKGEKVIPVIFTVQRDAGGSLMVWSGYLSKGKEGKLTIATIWNWISASSDPDSHISRTAINTAVFKPGSAQ